jgi:hypothetical protein
MGEGEKHNLMLEGNPLSFKFLFPHRIGKAVNENREGREAKFVAGILQIAGHMC